MIRACAASVNEEYSQGEGVIINHREKNMTDGQALAHQQAKRVRCKAKVDSGGGQADGGTTVQPSACLVLSSAPDAHPALLAQPNHLGRDLDQLVIVDVGDAVL